MRWRIPLVVALVAFVVVSCDQQPTEPQTDQVVAPQLAVVQSASSLTLLATTGNGATGPSTLLEIDPVTGATLQTIGPVGYIVNGLEFDPATGKLYGSTSVQDPNYNGLIEIDMTTGAGTPVGVHQWGGIPTAPANCRPSAVTNITIDAGGQMYGWLDPCDDDLVRIDKTTGIATWVGLSGVGTAANGLDFDSSDILYMIQFSEVYQVNVVTGLASLIGSYPSGGCCAHHGDFDLATDLYYAIGPGPNRSPSFLEVLDVANLTVVNTVPLEDDIHVLTFADLVIEVDLDIKPGSFPNSINPKSNGVVPVAILGSDEFDVTDVDVTTLAFGPAGAFPAHDLTNPATYWDHVQDVNLDGYMDLVSHYRQKQTGLAPGDTEACISGATLGGTPIEGCDSVRVLH